MIKCSCAPLVVLAAGITSALAQQSRAGASQMTHRFFCSVGKAVVDFHHHTFDVLERVGTASQDEVLDAVDVNLDIARRRNVNELNGFVQGYSFSLKTATQYISTQLLKKRNLWHT